MLVALVAEHSDRVAPVRVSHWTVAVLRNGDASSSFPVLNGDFGMLSQIFVVAVGDDEDLLTKAAEAFVTSRGGCRDEREKKTMFFPG